MTFWLCVAAYVLMNCFFWALSTIDYVFQVREGKKEFRIGKVFWALIFSNVPLLDLLFMVDSIVCTYRRFCSKHVSSFNDNITLAIRP